MIRALTVMGLFAWIVIGEWAHSSFSNRPAPIPGPDSHIAWPPEPNTRSGESNPAATIGSRSHIRPIYRPSC